MKSKKIELHENDIPDDLIFTDSVAVDTEAMGLQNNRDRLCLVQLSQGDDTSHLVQFTIDCDYNSPNLKKLFQDIKITKIFHYARFDLCLLKRSLNVDISPCYCTKIASKFARTYTDHHGLKALCSELLSVTLNKQQQCSDWGTAILSEQQKVYASNDVLYLHKLKEELDHMLERENRKHLADQAFNCLQTIVNLDIEGWDFNDIFLH